MFGSLKSHVYVREETRINPKFTIFLRLFRFIVTSELFEILVSAGTEAHCLNAKKLKIRLVSQVLT